MFKCCTLTLLHWLLNCTLVNSLNEVMWALVRTTMGSRPSLWASMTSSSFMLHIARRRGGSLHLVITYFGHARVTKNRKTVLAYWVTKLKMDSLNGLSDQALEFTSLQYCILGFCGLTECSQTEFVFGSYVVDMNRNSTFCTFRFIWSAYEPNDLFRFIYSTHEPKKYISIHNQA